VGATVQRVRALPCLHLDELTNDFQPFALGELCKSVTLGLNAEARASLAGRGDTNVRHNWRGLHGLSPFIGREAACKEQTASWNPCDSVLHIIGRTART
jgi:hypothetical protein